MTYETLIAQALNEDLNTQGDITTDAIVTAEQSASAELVLRSGGRVCGLELVIATFKALDANVEVVIHHPEGHDVEANTCIAHFSGKAKALLTAERVALNFFARLCSIATITHDVVKKIKEYNCQILCTRKTTPGLRALEKYAVRIGGGQNHRFGLFDAILIKDNHIAIAGSVTEAIKRVKEVNGSLPIEVEVDTLDQLNEALNCSVNTVLLDNMSPAQLREAVKIAKGKVLTEASGGITPANVATIAATGVDRISMGCLTQNAPMLDVGFDFK